MLWAWWSKWGRDIIALAIFPWAFLFLVICAMFLEEPERNNYGQEFGDDQ